MIIDCNRCTGHGAACGDCLVSALLDAPPVEARLTADEQRAIEAFGLAGFDVQVLDDTSGSVPPTPIPVAPLPSMPARPTSRPRSRSRTRRPRQVA
ncbi:hypothetical protein GCM10027280_30850 [Micromonospora polyrhachis]|uniref:Uncharacterized protein n=1 Tax=Micromonospora polyrhachis TaxID=1282883 RepID=A0A7W7WRN4_9ACTN|nr:hypothetical protein [Micromonospora polyrhachis]MBB4961114.1 hypothetical protein [Micromonospora polyrhachis]